jgi:endo-1,4-beta-xylanase
LVKTLRKKKLIDGVGFQSHFVVGTVPTDLQANLQRFADLGLDVALTELDIRAPTPITQAVINQHAKDFAYVVAACKAVSRCVGITTWGVTDRYSWIPGVFKGEDYGLLYDDKYATKKAYTQVIKALKA